MTGYPLTILISLICEGIKYSYSEKLKIFMPTIPFVNFSVFSIQSIAVLFHDFQDDS